MARRGQLPRTRPIVPGVGDFRLAWDSDSRFEALTSGPGVIISPDMAAAIDALTSPTLKHLREAWWDDEFTEFLSETLKPRPGVP